MKHVSLIARGAMMAAMMAGAGAAHAEGWVKDGGYVSVKGGWTKAEDTNYSIGAGRVETNYDDGYTASAAVGGRFYGMGRAELEVMHQKAGVDSQSLNGGATTNSKVGETKLNAAMVNGYWDMGDWVGVKPYIGAGVGAANLRFENHGLNNAQIMDDDDNVFAYQGMAGVAYDINPCWAVTGEYRYVGTGDASVRSAGGVSSDVDYQSHSALVGVRYTF